MQSGQSPVLLFHMDTVGIVREEEFEGVAQGHVPDKIDVNPVVIGEAIGFGPSRENPAHVVNEYVETKQLEKARKGYAAIASKMPEDTRA